MKVYLVVAPDDYGIEICSVWLSQEAAQRELVKGRDNPYFYDRFVMEAEVNSGKAPWASLARETASGKES
jgi:hypothetical protein